MRSVEYAGFTIKVRAFEIAGTGRFIASLQIGWTGRTRSSLIALPVTDGLFDSAEEALERTIAHARRIIDCRPVERKTSWDQRGANR